MVATRSAYKNMLDYYMAGIFPRRWTGNSVMCPFLFVLMLLPFKISFAGDNLNKKLSNRAMVDLFYQRREGRAFWFSSRPESIELRRQLVSLIEFCEQRGLDKYRYAYEPLKAHQDGNELRPDEKIVYDRLYTDVAISFLRDIQAGVGMEAMVSYDAFSLKYQQKDNARLMELLDTIQSGSSLLRAVETLEPSTEAYRTLVDALKKAIESFNPGNSSKLKTALNCYRWISHFGFEKYIVVNVPSATLHYFEAGSSIINMKIVAGMPATPTPRFAAHCDEVILYPYWNVPHSIAVKEILPAVKKVAGVLEFLNMQVIDKKGNIIDPATVHWTAYNSRNFPYRFRQSTGCDNALGVIKFNLTSPFSVYLHDTNMKPAFSATKRYFSHGCIRVEKPLELANYLLTEKLDDTYLAACLKDQRPVHIALTQPVPVFVVYVMAEAVADSQVVFYDDVYKLR